MIYLSNEAKLEVVKTLLVYDEVTVWYHNDTRKFEVTPHAMLTSTQENKTFIRKFTQKDFFKDNAERDQLQHAYEQAVRPLYAKTFDIKEGK